MRDIGEGTIRRIDWQELTPAVRLLRIFNTAMDVRILFLSGIGLLLTLIAGVMLNATCADRETTAAVLKSVHAVEIADPDDPNSELYFRPEGAPAKQHFSEPAYIEPLVDFQHVYFKNDRPVSFRVEPGRYLWTLAQRSVFVPWDIFSASGKRLFNIDKQSWTERGVHLFWFMLLLFIWTLSGGLICRTAALRLTVDRSESSGELLRFMKERGTGFLSSILILSLGIGFCLLLILLGGALFSVPGLNYLVGLGFPVVLLFAFFAVLLALGLLVGWPLLFAAVSTDGSDGYDAISRTFSYIFQRPLHYLFYWALAGIIGVLGFIFISVFIDGMVYLAVTLGHFPAQAALPAFGHLAIPEATTNLILPATLVLVWCALAQLVKLAFAFSWFWVSGVSVYLLLRKSVDAAPFSEVLLLGPAAAEPRVLPAVKLDEKGAPEIAE